MPNPLQTSQNEQYAEVILPLSVPGTFTYSIPKEWQNTLQIGQRVVVSFGGKKLYTGILHSFHSHKPELYQVKPLLSILEDYPIVPALQIRFWEWMAQYYLSSIGDVYRAAVPTALKLESETFIRKIEDTEIDWGVLDEYETLVMESLSHKSAISLKELEAFLPQQKIINVVRALYEEGWIRIDEKIIEKYKPKYIDYIRIKVGLEENPVRFQKALDELEKAPKQKEYLMNLIKDRTEGKPIERLKFQKKYGYTSSISQSLASKGIIDIYSIQKERMSAYSKELEPIEKLSPAQEKAFQSIQNHFRENQISLLEGVTSSGKTEIYMQLIQEQLEKGKSALFLLPEISISTQLQQRLQKKFGNEISVYHSKLNTQERVEVYKKVLEHKVKIVVGARSSIFLPFANLGLIIVDEEHETAYKQQDKKPYFNAKDSALVLAKLHQANILLGSATPSLESEYNSNNGKYQKIVLSERYGNVLPPKIELIDLQLEGIFEGEISPGLEEKMNETLADKKQVILFQNRRGYTPVMECVQCGYAPNCPNCDVKLNYHKYANHLKCHYCNFTSSLPEQCPVCTSTDFEYKGIGTQKIEEEVAEKFPKHTVFRMDSDTMRKKFAYEELFERFEAREIDILIGTQMISKGLDFSHVGMVGVVRADSLFNIPDFRIEEKTFQLLTQVAGRAGRRNEQGHMYIQTYNPMNPIYQALIQGKQKELYQYLLQERKDYQYPPYYKLIEIEFQHTNFEKTQKFATYFTHSLYSFIPQEYVLGPTQPSIGKVRNRFIFNSLIKIPREVSTVKIKEKLREFSENAKKLDGFKSVRMKIVVDPV